MKVRKLPKFTSATRHLRQNARWIRRGPASFSAAGLHTCAEDLAPARRARASSVSIPRTEPYRPFLWPPQRFRSAPSKGIGRQGIVLKHTIPRQKEPMPCRHMPLLVQLREVLTQRRAFAPPPNEAQKCPYGEVPFVLVPVGTPGGHHSNEKLAIRGPLQSP